MIWFWCSEPASFLFDVGGLFSFCCASNQPKVGCPVYCLDRPRDHRAVSCLGKRCAIKVSGLKRVSVAFLVCVLIRLGIFSRPATRSLHLAPGGGQSRWVFPKRCGPTVVATAFDREVSWHRNLRRSRARARQRLSRTSRSKTSVTDRRAE